MHVTKCLCLIDLFAHELLMIREALILTPISPFLNPVEKAIGFLKANIKADVSRPQIQFRMNEAHQGCNPGRLSLIL